LLTHQLVESPLGRKFTIISVCGVQMGLAVLVVLLGNTGQISLLFG
jgi:hypothetical protein